MRSGTASHHSHHRPSSVSVRHGHGHGRALSSAELEREWLRSNERKLTLTEWTHHLARITSGVSTTTPESSDPRRHAVRPRHWGSQAHTGSGYTGLDKHMSKMGVDKRARSPPSKSKAQVVAQTDWKYKSDPVCLRNSELFRQERNRMRKRGLVAKWDPHNGQQEEGEGEGEGVSPIYVTDAEVDDIRRCFEAADVTEDGYLNCEEFLKFMEYRRCPVTHLEARRLLSRTDAVYHSFIDLDQIMYLVFNCGLSTEQERSLSPSEFNHLMERVRSPSVTSMHHQHQDLNSNFIPRGGGGSRGGSTGDKFQEGSQYSHESPSVTVIEDSLEPHGAISYFEDIASHVQLKKSQEARYHEYRRGVRLERESRSSSSLQGQDRYSSSSGGLLQPGNSHSYPPPPGWKNMVLHSQDPASHVPPMNFRKLKGEWETILTVTEEQKRTDRARWGFQSEAAAGENVQENAKGSSSSSNAKKVSFSKSTSQPLPLSKCREALLMNRSPPSGSPSRTHQLQRSPERNAEGASELDKATAAPSVSFATELRQVLHTYKQRADVFTTEAMGKRDVGPVDQKGTSGLGQWGVDAADSTNIIFHNAAANEPPSSNMASTQISTHDI